MVSPEPESVDTMLNAPLLTFSTFIYVGIFWRRKTPATCLTPANCYLDTCLHPPHTSHSPPGNGVDLMLWYLRYSQPPGVLTTTNQTIILRQRASTTRALWALPTQSTHQVELVKVFLRTELQDTGNSPGQRTGPSAWHPNCISELSPSASRWHNMLVIPR